MQKFSRLAGWIGLGSGTLGVLAGLVLAFYPPAVAEDVYSYPFKAAGYDVSRVALTIRDLGIAVLIAGLWSLVGRSRAGRVGIIGGSLSMAFLAALEVISIAANGDADLGGAYGLACFAAGLFLIQAGITVARANPGRHLVWIAGAYVFVPLTPGILAGYVIEQLVVAGWMAVFAVLARDLLPKRNRTPQAESQIKASQ